MGARHACDTARNTGSTVASAIVEGRHGPDVVLWRALAAGSAPSKIDGRWNNRLRTMSAPPPASPIGWTRGRKSRPTSSKPPDGATVGTAGGLPVHRLVHDKQGRSADTAGAAGYLAVLCAGLDRPDKAFHWLDQVLRERHIGALFWASNPSSRRCDPIRASRICAGGWG